MTIDAMRMRTGNRRTSLGRRLGTAAVVAGVVAALAPASALAGLNDLTPLLPTPDATTTVDKVTSTVSEVTAPLTSSKPEAASQASSSVAPLPATPVPQRATEETPPVASTLTQTVAPLTAPVQQNLAPVVSVVQQTAAPLAAATAPLVTATAEPLVTTVEQVAAPVLVTAAPLLETADQVVATVTVTVDQTVAPVLQPVLDSAQQALAPVVTTTQAVTTPLTAPSARGDAAPAEIVRQATTPVQQGERSDGGPTAAAGVVATSPEQAPPMAPAPPARAGDAAADRAPHGGLSRAELRDRPAGPVVPSWVDAPFQGTLQPSLENASRGHRAAASSTRAPARTPARPDGFSVSAPPGGGGSIFVPLFALQAALLLLAAPGVGRRLGLTLAPPRLPILASSLERPG